MEENEKPPSEYTHEFNEKLGHWTHVLMSREHAKKLFYWKLQSLPDQARIGVLFYLSGCTVQEIAKAMLLSEEGVRAVLDYPDVAEDVEIYLRGCVLEKFDLSDKS